MANTLNVSAQPQRRRPNSAHIMMVDMDGEHASLEELTFASEMSSDFDALFSLAKQREKQRKGGATNAAAAAGNRKYIGGGSLNNLTYSTNSMTSSTHSTASDKHASTTAAAAAGGASSRPKRSNNSGLRHKCCTSYLQPHDIHRRRDAHHNHSSHCLDDNNCGSSNSHCASPSSYGTHLELLQPLSAAVRTHSEHVIASHRHSHTSMAEERHSPKRFAAATPSSPPKTVKFKREPKPTVTHLFKRTEKGLLRLNMPPNGNSSSNNARYDVRVTYGGWCDDDGVMTSHCVSLLGAYGVGKRAMMHDFLFPQESVCSADEGECSRKEVFVP